MALGATRRKAGGVSDIEGVGSCSVPTRTPVDILQGLLGEDADPVNTRHGVLFQDERDSLLWLLRRVNTEKE